MVRDRKKTKNLTRADRIPDPSEDEDEEVYEEKLPTVDEWREISLKRKRVKRNK